MFKPSILLSTALFVISTCTLEAENNQTPRGSILDNQNNPITLSPVGGYLDVDTRTKGKKGLLKYYDGQLSSGENVATSIDAKLQKSTESILDEMKVELNATEILAMVMNSKTGELVTIASSSRYDPMHIRRMDVPNLNPKFAEYPYEPGSVMQPITIAANLTTHLSQRDKYKEVFNTDYENFQIGKGLSIKDETKHKSQNMTDIVVSSSNIGTAQIAWQIPGNGFHYFLNKFGFGQKSGIDLPRDLTGTIKSETLLQEKLHIANSARGYGLMVTPMQLLKAYSAFSNEGWMVTPHIGTSRKYEAQEVLPKPIALKVKQMLTEVVKRGTGKLAQTEGLTIGGKTGTAHIAKNGRYVDDYHSSFYGFAEDSRAQSYTIGVLVIEPKLDGRHYASQSAVPVFKKIVDEMVHKKMLLVEERTENPKSKEHMKLLHKRLSLSDRKKEVVKYVGEKTITPLIDAKIVKHFGEVKDMEHGIKVFNESMTFQVPETNKNVFNVFDGKVIFVGKSKILRKVVVMSHKNKLNTVYAGISQISPIVRVGEQVGRGKVLGRVDNNLTFQVIQERKLVNPLEIFKKKRAQRSHAMQYIKSCDFNGDGVNNYRAKDLNTSDKKLLAVVKKEMECVLKELNKTISPLPWSRLVASYGVYEDKKSGKKFMREFIKLKPVNKKAKVYNVLDGEVLFRGDDDKLGKTIIMEHEDNLFTIYSNLAKISGDIKEERVVKKGTVLAQVDESLTFQVNRMEANTTKTKSIDPMEVIRFKTHDKQYMKVCDFNNDGLSNYSVDDIKHGYISKNDAVKELECETNILKMLLKIKELEESFKAMDANETLAPKEALEKMKFFCQESFELLQRVGEKGKLTTFKTMCDKYMNIELVPGDENATK